MHVLEVYYIIIQKFVYLTSNEYNYVTRKKAVETLFYCALIEKCFFFLGNCYVKSSSFSAVISKLLPGPNLPAQKKLGVNFSVDSFVQLFTLVGLPW